MFVCWKNKSWTYFVQNFSGAASYGQEQALNIGVYHSYYYIKYFSGTRQETTKMSECELSTIILMMQLDVVKAAQ